jgi:hypothetical protein
LVGRGIKEKIKIERHDRAGSGNEKHKEDIQQKKRTRT